MCIVELGDESMSFYISEMIEYETTKKYIPYLATT